MGQTDGSMDKRRIGGTGRRTRHTSVTVTFNVALSSLKTFASPVQGRTYIVVVVIVFVIVVVVVVVVKPSNLLAAHPRLGVVIVKDKFFPCILPTIVRKTCKNQ